MFRISHRGAGWKSLAVASLTVSLSDGPRALKREHEDNKKEQPKPIGSMYGIYSNIGDILMVNVTIYSIHGSYGKLIEGKLSIPLLCAFFLICGTEKPYDLWKMVFSPSLRESPCTRRAPSRSVSHQWQGRFTKHFLAVTVSQCSDVGCVC